MSHVSINLEDSLNGEVALQVVHTDGFDATSNAHKLSMQIVKWLDDQAATRRPMPIDGGTLVTAENQGVV
jgi:hypothetical protein